MTTSRDRGWMSLAGLLGGVSMFLAEAVIVVTLTAVAWLVSTVVLSLL